MCSEWLKIRSWKFWFLVFIIANILDLHSTAILILSVGIEVERNPIMVFLYQKWGFFGMVLLKITIICAVFWALRASEALNSNSIIRKLIPTLFILFTVIIAIIALCNYLVYFGYFVYFA